MADMVVIAGMDSGSQAQLSLLCVQNAGGLGGSTVNGGILATVAMGINPGNGRPTSNTQIADNADGQAAAVTGLQGVVARNQGWNGATWDRMYLASAANQAAQPKIGVQLVSFPGNWTLTSAPVAATQATATRAAGAAGVRHILTSIQASINAVAPVTVPLVIVVRDGTSGAGTILWQDRLTAVIGTDSRVSISGLAIVGSVATAMTIEFTAAPPATVFETVTATGYDTQ
jgi:hypothetical protein